MRILFLSQWFPYPPNNGSKLRIFNLLQGVASQHKVSLICFTDQYVPKDRLSSTILKTICADITVIEPKRFNPNNWYAFLGFFSRVPRSLTYTYSAEMEQAIKRSLYTSTYDLVVISQWTMMAYTHCFTEHKLLLEELELGWIHNSNRKSSSPWTNFRNRITWMKLRNYLVDLMKAYQACTVVSEEEKRLVEAILPGYKPIHVIPNCVNLIEYENVNVEPERNTIIFTGSFLYQPNYEGMLWFVERVLPIIRAEIPDIQIKVTGDYGGLSLPNNDNIIMTGYVNDIRTHIANAWLSIVPIMTGGGTRVKILETMALKTPVVSTTKGAEGLDIEAERDILIADSPEDFSHHIIRLCKSRNLRGRLSDNGYKLVREKYNWPTMMPKFLKIIDNINKSPEFVD